MISSTLANKLGLLRDFKPCIKTFRSANGGRNRPWTWPLGVLPKVFITIGSTTVPVSVFVSPAKNYTILLGNTFLSPARMIIDYESASVKCHKGDTIEIYEIIPMDFQNTGKERHPYTTKYAHIPMDSDSATDEDFDAKSCDTEESACMNYFAIDESADFYLLKLTIPLSVRF